MSGYIKEQTLWQSVLLRVLQDLLHSKSTLEREFEDAYRWVGNYPSKDFRMVCMLAGLEADFVHPRLKSLADDRVQKEASEKIQKLVAAE